MACTNPSSPEAEYASAVISYDPFHTNCAKLRRKEILGTGNSERHPFALDLVEAFASTGVSISHLTPT